MNKPITNDEATRLRRCIIDMGNKQNCYLTTGVHFNTVSRIIERRHAKETQRAKLFAYCNQVENTNQKTAA